MGIYTGDWAYGQYLKAVREAKEADKDSVTLCTEHCSERSDKDLKAWDQKDG